MLGRRLTAVIVSGRLVFGLVAVLLLLPWLASSHSAEERKYRIDSAKEVECARKFVLSQLVPLVPSVLEEAGMPSQRALAFCQEHPGGGMREGWDSLVDENYLRSLAVLEGLSKNVRRNYLRLSYQWAGPSSLWREEVADALSLSGPQRARVKEIVVESMELLAPANRDDFSYERPQSAAYHRRTAEIQCWRDALLLGVLNPAQLKAWQELKGPDSKAVEELRKRSAALRDIPDRERTVPHSQYPADQYCCPPVV